MQRIREETARKSRHVFKVPAPNAEQIQSSEAPHRLTKLHSKLFELMVQMYSETLRSWNGPIPFFSKDLTPERNSHDMHVNLALFYN